METSLTSVPFFMISRYPQCTRGAAEGWLLFLLQFQCLLDSILRYEQSMYLEAPQGM